MLAYGASSRKVWAFEKVDPPALLKPNCSLQSRLIEHIDTYLVKRKVFTLNRKCFQRYELLAWTFWSRLLCVFHRLILKLGVRKKWLTGFCAGPTLISYFRKPSPSVSWSKIWSKSLLYIPSLNFDWGWKLHTRHLSFTVRRILDDSWIGCEGFCDKARWFWLQHKGKGTYMYYRYCGYAPLSKPEANVRTNYDAWVLEATSAIESVSHQTYQARVVSSIQCELRHREVNDKES